MPVIKGTVHVEEVRSAYDKARKKARRAPSVSVEQVHRGIHFRRVNERGSIQVYQRDARGVEHLVYERKRRLQGDRRNPVLELKKRRYLRDLVIRLVRKNKWITRHRATKMIMAEAKITYSVAKWAIDDLLARKDLRMVVRKDQRPHKGPSRISLVYIDPVRRMAWETDDEEEEGTYPQ